MDHPPAADQTNEAPIEEPKKKFSFGCLPQSFLLGAAMVAGGGSLLNRWATLGGAGKTAGIMLVVLGTFLALPLLLYLFVKLLIRHFFGKLAKDLTKATTDLAGSSKALLEGNKAMYEKVHEFRDAGDDDFDGLDRAAYDATRDELAGTGWSHLGDIVDQTIEELGHPSPVIRLFAAPDGSATLAFYHLALPSFAARKTTPFFVDVATEFTDGSFLCTSNTQGSDLTTPPPTIHKRQFPQETPVAQLIEAHQSERQKLAAAKAGTATVITLTTLQDALESEKRQQATKNEFRKRINYVDPEEVRRVASTVHGVDEAGADMAARAADEARRAQE